MLSSQKKKRRTVRFGRKDILPDRSYLLPEEEPTDPDWYRVLTPNTPLDRRPNILPDTSNLEAISPSKLNNSQWLMHLDASAVTNSRRQSRVRHSTSKLEDSSSSHSANLSDEIPVHTRPFPRKKQTSTNPKAYQDILDGKSKSLIATTSHNSSKNVSSSEDSLSFKVPDASRKPFQNRRKARASSSKDAATNFQTVIDSQKSFTHDTLLPNKSTTRRSSAKVSEESSLSLSTPPAKSKPGPLSRKKDAFSKTHTVACFQDVLDNQSKENELLESVGSAARKSSVGVSDKSTLSPGMPPVKSKPGPLSRKKDAILKLRTVDPFQDVFDNQSKGNELLESVESPALKSLAKVSEESSLSPSTPFENRKPGPLTRKKDAISKSHTVDHFQDVFDNQSEENELLESVGSAARKSSVGVFDESTLSPIATRARRNAGPLARKSLNKEVQIKSAFQQVFDEEDPLDDPLKLSNIEMHDRSKKVKIHKTKLNELVADEDVNLPLKHSHKKPDKLTSDGFHVETVLTTTNENIVNVESFYQPTRIITRSSGRFKQNATVTRESGVGKEDGMPTSPTVKQVPVSHSPGKSPRRSRGRSSSKPRPIATVTGESGADNHDISPLKQVPITKKPRHTLGVASNSEEEVSKNSPRKQHSASQGLSTSILTHSKMSRPIKRKLSEPNQTETSKNKYSKVSTKNIEDSKDSLSPGSNVVLPSRRAYNLRPSGEIKTSASAFQAVFDGESSQNTPIEQLSLPIELPASELHLTTNEEMLTELNGPGDQEVGNGATFIKHADSSKTKISVLSSSHDGSFHGFIDTNNTRKIDGNTRSASPQKVDKSLKSLDNADSLSYISTEYPISPRVRQSIGLPKRSRPLNSNSILYKEIPEDLGVPVNESLEGKSGEVSMGTPQASSTRLSHQLRKVHRTSTKRSVAYRRLTALQVHLDENENATRSKLSEDREIPAVTDSSSEEIFTPKLDEAISGTNLKVVVNPERESKKSLHNTAQEQLVLLDEGSNLPNDAHKSQLAKSEDENDIRSHSVASSYHSGTIDIASVDGNSDFSVPGSPKYGSAVQSKEKTSDNRASTEEKRRSRRISTPNKTHTDIPSPLAREQQFKEKILDNRASTEEKRRSRISTPNKTHTDVTSPRSARLQQSEEKTKNDRVLTEEKRRSRISTPNKTNTAIPSPPARLQQSEEKTKNDRVLTEEKRRSRISTPNKTNTAIPSPPARLQQPEGEISDDDSVSSVRLSSRLTVPNDSEIVPSSSTTLHERDSAANSSQMVHSGDINTLGNVSAKTSAPKHRQTNLNSFFFKLPPGMSATQYLAKLIQDDPQFVERREAEKKKLAEINENKKKLLLAKRAEMRISQKERLVFSDTDFLPVRLPDREKTNVKVPKPKKPIHPELLVNGKPWRAPKLRRPKPWVTDRFYSVIFEKCAKQFGEIKKRRKAEMFVVEFCHVVSQAIRCKKNFEPHVQKAKEMLYKLGVIKTLLDFHVFIENYLPEEFRYNAIPTVRAYGVLSGLQSDINKNLNDDLKLFVMS